MAENWMLVVWLGSLTNVTIIEYHNDKESCYVRKIEESDRFDQLNLSCVNNQDLKIAREKDLAINLKFRGIKK